MPNMFFTIRWVIDAVKAAQKKSATIKSEKGVITMEYGLLGVLLATALVGSVQYIRDTLFDMLTTIINAFP
jgi:Flp pilus assembly pilin Flp